MQRDRIKFGAWLSLRLLVLLKSPITLTLVHCGLERLKETQRKIRKNQIQKTKPSINSFTNVHKVFWDPYDIHYDIRQRQTEQIEQYVICILNLLVYLVVAILFHSIYLYLKKPKVVFYLYIFVSSYIIDLNYTNHICT